MLEGPIPAAPDKAERSPRFAIYCALWFFFVVVSLQCVDLNLYVMTDPPWVKDSAPFWVRLIVGAFIALACVVFLDLCLAGPSAFRRIVGDRHAPHASDGQTPPNITHDHRVAVQGLACLSMVCLLALADRGSYVYSPNGRVLAMPSPASSVLESLVFEIPVLVGVTLLCTWIIRNAHHGLRSTNTT